MAGGYQERPDQEEDPEWSPDGYGNASYNNQIEGENAYDKSVDEYRKRGAQVNPDGSRRVAPIQLNQAQADESRGLEMNALAMLRRQGAGTAPSAAEIMSQRVNQTAVQNAGQQTTAARGVGSRLVAAGNAGQQAGTAMLAGNAQNADMRAGEISQGQGAYSGAAGAVNTQDIGAATTNAGLEAQQRALDELRQQANERLAYDTRRTQHSAQTESIRQAQQERDRQRANDAARTQADFDKVKTVVGTVVTAGQGASQARSGEAGTDPNDKRTTSDPKSKQNVMHMGSLSSLYRSRGH